MLNRDDAATALRLLTAYANSGVSDDVSLACAQVCRELRDGLNTDDVGRDLALIDVQRAENVRLTVEAEAAGTLMSRFVAFRRKCTQQGATLADLMLLDELEATLERRDELYRLALEGSRNDTTGKAMRAANEKALGLCLKWGGVR